MREENDLSELYERALRREHRISYLEKKKLPPIIIQSHQKLLKNYEALIAAHPSKPKTLEEEIRIKLDIIDFNIFNHRNIGGLCNDCVNYLSNRIINGEVDTTRAKERIKAIQPDDIVCTKIKPALLAKEPMPAICPYYEQDEILAGGLGYNDIRTWEKLRQKYESMLPESQKGPRKRF